MNTHDRIREQNSISTTDNNVPIKHAFFEYGQQRLELHYSFMLATAPSLHLSGSIYVGETHICGPLSLNAPAGQWTCLLGPTGTGKSTILRLLAGIIPNITFTGKLRAGDDKPLDGRVALMSQTDLLMPWLKVMDNITLGACLRGEIIDYTKVWQVLTHVGLDKHAEKKPHNLSGGQKQRVALARTLLENRPIVLLDEPFSSLDTLSRTRMQDLAETSFRGRSVLHVTHDLVEAARLSHKIVLISSDSLTEISIDETTPPRAPDAPETLALQTRLLHLLMEMA